MRSSGSIASDRNVPRGRGKVCAKESVDRPLHAVMHEASGIADRSIHRETWQMEEPEPRDFLSRPRDHLERLFFDDDNWKTEDELANDNTNDRVVPRGGSEYFTANLSGLFKSAS
jgi:hypothetical protein